MPRSLYCSLSRQCKYGKGYGKSGNPYRGSRNGRRWKGRARGGGGAGRTHDGIGANYFVS